MLYCAVLEKLVAAAATIHQESHLLTIRNLRLRTEDHAGTCFEFVFAKKILCFTMYDLRSNARKQNPGIHGSI